jgi:hypothetical protein
MIDEGDEQPADAADADAADAAGVENCGGEKKVSMQKQQHSPACPAVTC